VKKDEPVKKEVKDELKEMLAQEEDERPWWLKEMALADAARYPDDPADEPGLHMLQVRSFKEPQPMDETLALLWSAEDSGVLVNLTKNDDAMSQVKKEVKDEF
jgi:hypothetical protein